MKLARYDTDGRLDGSFGTGGVVTVVFNGGSFDKTQGVAIQPDGRIVVVGFTRVGTSDDFAVARYDAAGIPDMSFGTGGKVSTDFGGGGDKAWAVRIQTDGKIVVAGHAAMPSALGVANDFAVARYDAAGNPDMGFSTDGRVTTDIAGRTDLAFAAALQSDGKIVVAGRVADSGGDDPDVGLVRYDENGNPDPSFGDQGIVRRDVSGGAWDEASDVAMQPDGKIVVAARSIVGGHFGFAVARFDIRGDLDNGFGDGGVATTSFSTNDDYPAAVAVQSDGNIVVAGQSSNLVNPDFAIARFDGGGTLDPSFGTGGKVTVDFFGSGDGAESVAVQTDGKIVVSGFGVNGSSNDFALARLVP